MLSISFLVPASLAYEERDGSKTCEGVRLGVPDEKLKITYVKAVQLNQAHMILAYYPSPGAEPLILDNLINEILPASERPDLVPVYSFNGEGLWLSKLSSQEGKRIGNANKLESWKDLMTRHTRLFD